MTVPRPLAAVLHEATHELKLELGHEQIDRLLDYVDLLAHWNRTYNLTAVRDPRAMVTQHVVDCLATVTPLRREIAAARAGRRLLDVGSGAGLPGIVVAIAAPEFEVVCVDSVGKKAAFIAHASGVLNLRNVGASHHRVERLSLPAFDVIASRAFSSLPDLVSVTQHLLSPGGMWLAMKGLPPDDELAALKSCTASFHVEQVVVPGLNASRCLVWMQPLNHQNSEHSLCRKTMKQRHKSTEARNA